MGDKGRKDIKPKGYWTLERCQKEVLKCSSRNDVKKKIRGAYNAIYENNWKDEVFGVFKQIKHPPNYWTKERCIEVAKKCKYLSQFKLNYSTAYSKSIKKGWLEEICNNHLVRGHIKKFNKDECHKIAKLYKTRTEFSNNSNHVYKISIKNKWLDDICDHMIEVGHKYKRLIYVYQFDDNHVYVGLTDNIERRSKQHKIDISSPIYKHSKKTNLTPKLTYGDYISAENAQKLEGETVEYYRKKGFSILNIAKTGSLGGASKWTKENVLQEAKLYTTRRKFQKGSSGAYNSALKKGFLDEVCQHMVSPIKKSGHWNYENCKNIALKFKSRSEFIKKAKGAYESSSRNGWLSSICSHMTRLKSPPGYWTLNILLEISKEFSTLLEFRKKYNGGYQAALKHGWINEIFPPKIK